jgi:hypothetical protein
LKGHYAHLKGLHAQQARAAFASKVLQKSDEGYTIATFAGGCFWGPQLLFDRASGFFLVTLRVHQPCYQSLALLCVLDGLNTGVKHTSVGYTQGREAQPDYNIVSIMCHG